MTTNLHAIVHDDWTVTHWEADENGTPITPPNRVPIWLMPWTHDTLTANFEFGPPIYRIGEDE